MRRWARDIFKEFRHVLKHLGVIRRDRLKKLSAPDRFFMLCGSAISILTLGVALIVTAHTTDPRTWRLPGFDETPPRVVDLSKPVRDIPVSFPPNSHRPTRKEQVVSGPINLRRFDPMRDLIYIEDPRAWWESDFDKNDVEDDHLIHGAMKEPLLRLIELVHAAGGELKVQDTYREVGIHHDLSLHKEGRAIDLTCDELGLEKLAALCWASGFDWVYHESPKRGGAHVHCSVKNNR